MLDCDCEHPYQQGHKAALAGIMGAINHPDDCECRYCETLLDLAHKMVPFAFWA